MATNDELGPDLEQGDTTDMRSSPTRIGDPALRREAARALVWVGVVGLAVLAVYIARPLLVIFGAMVFASMIDGGARLLGRILPIGRTWRVALVMVLTVAFFAWLVYFAGATISQEAAQFPALIEKQLNEVLAWARSQGLEISQQHLERYAGSIGSGIGTLTKALSGIVGGLTSILIIVIIGIYVALEPQLYERGVAWMLPKGQRSEFYKTAAEMARTLRRLMAGRLLGMFVEAVFTYILLAWYGVPMAVLLAILTGLLAFIPNIGALISGALMILVGFSGGYEMGLYTTAVYFFVQNFDGYVVIPMIAKKTVDLAPALVLAAQLVMGILFGILGLFLADPLLAMIKVALERRAQQSEDQGTADAEAASGT